MHGPCPSLCTLAEPVHTQALNDLSRWCSQACTYAPDDCCTCRLSRCMCGGLRLCAGLVGWFSPWSRQARAQFRAALEIALDSMSSMRDKKRKVRSDPGEAAQGSLTLHTCEAVPWRPQPVSAISPCPDGTVVAVARDSGSIEIVDTASWCSCVVRLPSLGLPRLNPGAGLPHLCTAILQPYNAHQPVLTTKRQIKHMLLRRSSHRIIWSIRAKHARPRALCMPAPRHICVTTLLQCEQVIPGKPEAAISALAWSHDSATKRWRLFSAGLDGLLLEWDIAAQQPLVVSHSIGGAAWALCAEPSRPQQPLRGPTAASELSPAEANEDAPVAALRGGDAQADADTSSDDDSRGDAQPNGRVLHAGAPHKQHNADRPDSAESTDTRFALAADDGSVRLLVAEAGGAGLVYQRMLGRASARALSLAWSHDGSVVFAGFADGCIRALNVATGAPAGASNQRCPVTQRAACLTEPERAGVCTAANAIVAALKDYTAQTEWTRQKVRRACCAWRAS